MTIRLHEFDAEPRCYAGLTPPSYATLGALLAAAEGAEAIWTVDLDPRWRTLVFYSTEADARPGVEALLEAASLEAKVEAEGPYRLEMPREAATGKASRPSSRRGGPKLKTEIEVRVRAGDPATAVRVEWADGVEDPVTGHGVLRAARRGPSRGYPIAAAVFEVTVRLEGEGDPGLADLHAAAQQAAARAIDEGGTVVLTPDTRQPDGEPPVLVDLETSIADVALNLEALCQYPVDRVDEHERSQLGSFIAYQVSMLYGHTLDERMRRVPAAPPVGLRPFLASVTDRLLAHADATGPAGAMVGELIRTWTTAWIGEKPTP